MFERRVVVGSKVGLHARPAAEFAKAAAAQSVPVTIAKTDGEPVDAKSMLLVITLDARGGDEVVLRAEGDGAEAALDALEAVLKTDYDA